MGYFFGIVLRIVEKGECGICLSYVFAFDYYYIRFVVKLCRLSCRKNNVSVVGQHENMFGVCLIESVHKVVCARIFALSAVDNHIGSAFFKCRDKPLSGSNGDKSEFLSRFFHAQIIVVDQSFAFLYNRGFVMLKRHVFYFNSQKFAVTLSKFQHFPRRHGVNMHFKHGTGNERHNRVAAYTCQIIDKNLRSKGFEICLGTLQTQQNFGAIAEFHNAVLGEFIEIYFVFHGLFNRIVNYVLASDRRKSAFRNVHKPRSAAVGYARFFQNGKQLRRAFKRRFCLGEIIESKAFERTVGGDSFSRIRGGFAGNGENGAFYRIDYRFIGTLDASVERSSNVVKGGALNADKAFCHAAEKLRQNNARVSSCIKQHSVGQCFGFFLHGIGGDVFHSVKTAAYGHTHIFARISVGDREHVQFVHGARVRF